MATVNCITDAVQQQASAQCARYGPVAGAASCALAREKVCPPPDVAPVIAEGASGIQTVGIADICQSRPTVLAPYPPTRPVTSEAAQSAALARLTTQAQAQSASVMKLRSQAARAMKLRYGWGFWLGLGLVSVGAVAWYARR